MINLRGKTLKTFESFQQTVRLTVNVFLWLGIKDSKCVLYGIAAGLLYEEKVKTGSNALEASSYDHLVNSWNLEGLSFPMQVGDVEKLLKNNDSLHHVTINFYCLFNKLVFPCLLGVGSMNRSKYENQERKTISLLTVDLMGSKKSFFNVQHILCIKNLGLYLHVEFVYFVKCESLNLDSYLQIHCYQKLMVLTRKGNYTIVQFVLPLSHQRKYEFFIDCICNFFCRLAPLQPAYYNTIFTFFAEKIGPQKILSR